MSLKVNIRMCRYNIKSEHKCTHFRVPGMLVFTRLGPGEARLGPGDASSLRPGDLVKPGRGSEDQED